MKRAVQVLAAGVIAVVPASAAVAAHGAAASEGAGGHVALTEGELTWVAGPPSLPPGAKMTILEGNPGKPGPFTMRVKAPDGYRIPPHWHPGVEHVTVLQGTFLIGTGEKWDRAAMKELPIGGFMAMPIGMRHFAGMKGETTIQLHGIGPWKINYLNPADDPRRQPAGKK